MHVARFLFVVACTAASQVNNYPALFAVAALAGLGHATFHPVGFTILNQRVSAPRLGFAFSAHGLTMMIKKATSKWATGRVYGLVYSGLHAGFAIAPMVFGVLMERGWFGATPLGAATVLLLSVVAAPGVGQGTVSAACRASKRVCTLGRRVCLLSLP